MKQTTSHLEWKEFLRFINCLEIENKLKLRLVCATCCYTALRISDVLSLKWGDVLGKDFIVLNELKTKKTRKIKIHKDLKAMFYNDRLDHNKLSDYVFLNRHGNKPISREYVNRELKVAFKKYNIKYYGNISSHLFRKTFGRFVIDHLGYDKGMMLLQEILNHSSVEITRAYLGITQTEIDEAFTALPSRDAA